MIGGLDEVGRGALAGPVVVGAVILKAADPEEWRQELLLKTGLKRLSDSKKLQAAQRELIVKQAEQLDWAVGQAEAWEIDLFGLTEAISLAAERALFALPKLPKQIKADAGLNHHFRKELPTEHFIKGDEQILEIMLASIFAKVWRDNLMRGLDKQYLAYGFAQHKGYGTKQHLQAIERHGPSAQHRRLFLRKRLSGG